MRWGRGWDRGARASLPESINIVVSTRHFEKSSFPMMSCVFSSLVRARWQCWQYKAQWLGRCWQEKALIATLLRTKVNCALLFLPKRRAVAKIREKSESLLPPSHQGPSQPLPVWRKLWLQQALPLCVSWRLWREHPGRSELQESPPPLARPRRDPEAP